MDVYVLLATIVIVLDLSSQIDCVDWNYGRLGPEVWAKKYKDCAGHRQSPVNIQTACTMQQTFPPFVFSSLHKELLQFTLYNDGHTIMAKYDGPKVTLFGGNLDSVYQFDHFHLHWGPNENVGSEHQVNGEKYTGESHFVYKDPHTGNLAVLGFFMKSVVNSTDIPHDQHDDAISYEWRRYFDAVEQLLRENDTMVIDFSLSLMMGKNLNDFWRYNGSLTIPPCSENVTWTVFRQPIYIYDYHFERFRDDLLFESYRGPQPLYNRQIYRSFSKEILSDIPDQNCCPSRHV